MPPININMVIYLSYIRLEMAGVVRILGVLSIFVIYVQCSYLAGFSKVSKPTNPIVKCGPVCKKFCKFGNVLDHFGCPTCQCKPDPCKPVLCKMKCPSGFQRDKKGCQICKCKIAPKTGWRCDVPKKRGPCLARIPRYFFNENSGKCESFEWGGCQSNGNNFKTREACARLCEPASRCDQPMKRGPCLALIPRYYYNQQTGKCQQFYWGGCLPNGNNFRTLHGCQGLCESVIRCFDPKKVGPCLALIPRYYFNFFTGQCEKFDWGGCQPNGNNFHSLQACEGLCESVSRCFDHKKSGPCEAAIPRYFYNKRTGRCQKFVWGGCQPNGNNFHTLSACKGVCETTSRCDEPLKVGPCRAAIPRFYYNKVKGMCQRFSWGGCQPNGNNFRTMKACRRVCGCDLPKKEGPCDGVNPRYFYNKKSRHCEKFNYGGCQGNGNRFRTLKGCKRLCYYPKPQCGPVCLIHCPFGNVLDAHGCPICKCKPAPCPKITCIKTCSNGYLKDKNGCQTCTCKPGFPSHSSSCNAPKKVGPCKARIPRYYYNQATGKCEKFFWGGCQANSNNFETEAICKGVCVCGPVCAIFCEFGNVLDERGCPTCRCREAPCPKIKCVKICSNGYLKDKNGCQTCTCKPGFPSHSSSCNAPKKVGPCKAGIPRYYYNQATGKCEKFFWGGCQANSNNFETETICKGVCVCGPVCAIFCEFGNVPDERGCPTCRCRERPCPLIKCSNPCQGEREVDKNGCSTCKCKPSKKCLEPKKIGPCRASIPRYYYDDKSKTCKKFYWGGCNANGNNFEKLSTCKRLCNVKY